MSVARPIPVFRPTAEEFSDFSKYVTSIEPIAEQYGICKIVPPEGWRPRVSSYDDLNIEIPCPIRQFVHGKQGVYQVVNVMEKPMTLAQFKQASDEQFAKCFPKSKREGSDAEKFDIEELERRFWKNLTFHAPLYGADMLGTLFEDESEEGDAEHASKENDDAENGGAEGEIDVVQVEIANDEPPAKGKKKSQQQQRSPKRKRGADTDAADSTATAPAPAPASSEIAKRNAWNLGHLDTLLSQRLGKLLPGVTSPYLYFGMWKSLFACHTEDMDLYSINFLHFGKPKVWYGVPSAQKHRVDQVARLHFPMQFKECAEFLRHKSSMFSPSTLKMGNVSLTHAVQQPGEFIITFPGAYHFGFNAGFNCAEAVNFALQRWLDFGKKAKPCKCVADSVTIDVGMFINMVANGEEVPDVLPAAKKSKGNSTPKPKRIAKRRSREKAATTTATVATKVGGRSMGMVTGRMMATPLASAALPHFVEETLADEDVVPALSEDELRSGDENDGGEYLEGSKARQKQAKKPRRSKRMENKRGNATPSDTTDGSEAPASSKRPKERKESARRKKQAKVANAPPTTTAEESSEVTPKEEQKPKTAKASTTAAAPKPPARKRAVKRKKDAKVADNVQKKAKGQEPTPDAQKVEEAPVNTREYQGLKIIIRPPRADSSNGSPVPTTDTPASATTTTGARKKRAGAGKRSTSKKPSPTRKGKKANPDLMPEGKTTAWQQLNADANSLHNRDAAATEPTQVKLGGPESCPGQQATLVQSTISSFYTPYTTGAAGRQQGTPSYGHFLVGERTQRTEERPQPTQVLQASETQLLPTLKDFMSQGSSYPLLSSFTSSFSTSPAPTGSAQDQTVQPGSAYSLALELQRHKLRELREKQQQLQQLRHEQQPQLQQLQQFIHAQRQLQHEPASSSSSSAYSAGRYASGLPSPLPTLPTSTTSTMPTSLSPFSSTIAAAYGLPLPPSPSTSTSIVSSSPFPPPLHYSLPPLPPHLHMERLASAPAQAPPDSTGGAATHKLVHILPSPAPASALATLHAPRSSPSTPSSSSALASSVPSPAPSSFPVSS